MQGTILGYDPTKNTGTISASDGDRYNFKHADWNENGLPKKGEGVDFGTKDGDAVAIYSVKNKIEEQNEKMMGVISILITFLFGFIGTELHKPFRAFSREFRCNYCTYVDSLYCDLIGTRACCRLADLYRWHRVLYVCELQTHHRCLSKSLTTLHDTTPF